MRSFVTTGMTGMILLASLSYGAAMAEVQEDSFAAADAVTAEEAATEAAGGQAADDQASEGEEAPAPATHVNRWVCYAESRGLFERRFTGYSQWFPAGSGQGQAAHTLAYDNALKECRRFRPVGGCISNFQSDCSVERR